MRITENLMTQNMLNNLHQNMENLDEYNQKLSSGKEFRFPSDAPIEAARSMGYTSDIAKNDQYEKNIDQARSWMQTTESAMDDSNHIIQRARELTVQASNDTLTEADRSKLANEFEELEEELAKIAETRHGDRYVFAGQSTDDSPLEEGEEYGNYDYVGDDLDIKREVTPGVELPVNLRADEAFGDALEVMADVREDLENGDEIGDELLDDFDEAIDENLEQRSELGARMNRLDMIERRIEDETLNLRELRSENEDTDFAETIMEMRMQESVYQASLATGARSIQPSLVDFLQ